MHSTWKSQRCVEEWQPAGECSCRTDAQRSIITMDIMREQRRALQRLQSIWEVAFSWCVGVLHPSMMPGQDRTTNNPAMRRVGGGGRGVDV